MLLPLTARNTGMTVLVNVTHIRRVWVDAAGDLGGSDAQSKSNLILFIQCGEDQVRHRYVPLDATGKPWLGALDKDRALEDFMKCVRRALSD